MSRASRDVFFKDRKDAPKVTLDAIKQERYKWGFHVDNPVDSNTGDTLLIRACEAGDIDAVSYVLEELKADVNMTNKDNCSALFRACENNQPQIVELLLAQKADVNLKTTSKGFSAAHIAAYFGFDHIIELLRDVEDMNIDCCNNAGYTPMAIAISQGRQSTMELLLSLGADTSTKTNEGYSLLYISVSENNTEAFRLLMDMEEDFNEPDNNGCTPLYIAALKGYSELVKMLCKSGAKVNQGNHAGWSPFYVASYKGHIEVIKILHGFGADIDAKNNAGWSPIFAAVASKTKNQLECVTTLLGLKVDITFRNNAGCSLAYIAASNGNLPILNLLISMDADICEPNNDGVTPLLAATINGSIEVVNALIEHGGDCNTADNNKKTPLHVASSSGMAELVSLFVELEADVDCYDGDNMSPLLLAISNGHANIAEILLSAGADYNALNAENFSALHLACIKGLDTVCTMLLELSAEVNTVSKCGTTPILDAVKIGHLQIVNELLATEACSVTNSVLSETGDSILHLAASSGSVAMVSKLVELGAPATSINSLGQYPIHIAVHGDQLDIVKLLLAQGTPVSVVDHKGNNLFIESCKYGNRKIVQFILAEFDKAKLDINAQNDDKYTAFHYAASMGLTEVCQYLISVGAKHDVANMEGYKPIDLAVISGRLDTVKYLFQQGFHLTNQDSGVPPSPLLLIAREGNSAMVDFVLQDNRVDVDVTDAEGSTPLILAAGEGHMSTVEILLKHHAAVNVINDSGMTAVCAAASTGEMQIVRLLKSAGASVIHCPKKIFSKRPKKREPDVVDIDLTNSKRNVAPIFEATRNGHKDVVVYLLDNGVDLLSIDGRGMNLLFIAAQEGHAELVKLLIERGIDSNIKCDKPSGSNGVLSYHDLLLGLTSKGCPQVLAKRILQKIGADITANLADIVGSTPLYAASRGGHIAAVQALLENSADPNIVNKECYSPLFAASEGGYSQIARKLLDAGARVDFATKENLTPLHAASAMGHIDIVRLLLDNGADINFESMEGISALHAAATAGHFDCFKCLVDAGADINSCDMLGRSIMFEAATSGNIQMIKYLIDLGVNIEKDNIERCTPLFMAAKFGRLEAVKLLIECGANVNIIANPHDNNVFHHYRTFAQSLYSVGYTPQQVQMAIIEAGGDIDISLTSQSRCTPVNIAAFGGHTEIVLALIKAGADLTIGNVDGYTPLFTAAAKNHIPTFIAILDSIRQSQAESDVTKYYNIKNINNESIIQFVSERGGEEIVKYLLEVGACLDALDVVLYMRKDNKEFPGYGLIHYAALTSNVVMLKLLLKLGCQVDLATEKDNLTALFCAAQFGNLEIIRLLIENNANVDLKAPNGYPPIAVAAGCGHTAAVKLLHEHKADVKLKGMNGNNALHLAAREGRYDTAKVLIECGADIDATDDAGQTALYIAAAVGHCNVVKLLIDSKANLDKPCRDESTPMQIAAIGKRFEIVKLLLKSNAKFPMKLNSGWTRCKGTVDMGIYLMQLVFSMSTDDTEFVQIITDRCVEEGLPLLYYLVELGVPIATSKATDEAMHKEVVRVESSKQCYPVQVELRQFNNDSPERIDYLTSLVQVNSDSLTDVDYFGNTALMVAINVDAPNKIIEEILHQVLITKLTRNFSSLLRISLKPKTKHRFPSFRLANVEFSNAKVYIEATLLTGGVFQIGTASHDWYPTEGEVSHGVGDSSCSIGIDVSRQCFFDDGVRRDNKSIPPWTDRESETVVGICLDTEAMVIEFLVNGAYVSTPRPISLAEYGDNGVVFALTVSPGATCELNFGDVVKRPLRYRPEGYKSVKEYFEYRGKVFVPVIQICNLQTSSWENVLPNDDCPVSKYYFDWFQAIQSTNEKLLNCACAVIERNYLLIREISNDTNENEYRAIDIASKRCKKSIHSILFFVGRYDLVNSKADYESNNSVLFLATDSITNAAVAIKLMKYKENYLQELNSRNGLESAYIISILQSFDGDQDPKFREEVKKRNYEDYKYCIIMPAARRNLYQILLLENIAGSVEPSKLSVVRRLFEDLVNCVAHLHAKGVLHGDIKPLNVMRNAEDKLILIDLDASCSLGSMAGLKYSPAYLPPEMFFFDVVAGEYRVKDRSYFDDEGNFMLYNSAVHSTGDASSLSREESIQLQRARSKRISFGAADGGTDDAVDKLKAVVAEPSYDVWSLGAVLYHMCTGEMLFLSSYDNIDQKDRKILFQWNEKYKSEKLEKVKHIKARNLVSRLLSKDPKSRPTLSAILQHPFISNKDSVRMVGQEPAFDVFLSYRVDSDKEWAEKMYDMLIAKQLKVWWDKKCLENGKDWEEGFCDGLVQSKVFVCLISKDAIGNPKSRRCFTTLSEDSECDNVLLEHQLALELEAMKLISNVYPVLIGPLKDMSPPTFAGFDWPLLDRMPNISVHSVAQKVTEHLERQQLGSPLFPNRTVSETMNTLKKRQAYDMVGQFEAPVVASVELSFKTVVDNIYNLCVKDTANAASDREKLIPSKSVVGAELSDAAHCCENAQKLKDLEAKYAKLSKQYNDLLSKGHSH